VQHHALYAACVIGAIVLAVVFGLPPLRRQLVSRFVMPVFAKVLPKLGATERIALEAGTVWWDGDLFGGMPDWNKLLAFAPAPLREDEQAFLDGPATELCRRLDDWAVYQQRDLPPEIWQYIKEQRFLGMVVPKEFGGLGFSAIAHSRVVTRIASRSVTAAVTVMVPNSLGPGELLLHYGTDEQKKNISTASRAAKKFRASH
jgi:acyl-CoA dehydrogenase